MSEEPETAKRSGTGDGAGDEPATNVQTLTDLFDQLDRAAFRRVLEYRESFKPKHKRTGSDSP